MSSIMCFRHCEKNTNIFCFEVPARCPLCDELTETSESRIPPFEIGCPFSDASISPFSLVIKPTNVQFLNGYTDDCDLHIGVTSSSGVVYEFDEHGVTTGSCDWTTCVCVPIIDRQSQNSWKILWDSHLTTITYQPQWKPERYDESSCNCFDFVLSFLRSLPVHPLTLTLSSKRQFCEDVIITETRTVAKYITVYKQIQHNGYVITPVDR